MTTGEELSATLIIYVPLLFAGYFFIDLFYTEKAEIPDSSMATTEYLNPELPDAKMRGDGIGNKYESMLKSYGRIDDYTAMNNIDRNNEEVKEGYDSKYSDSEREQIESQESQKLDELQRQLQESAQKGQEIASGTNLSEEERLARRVELPRTRSGGTPTMTSFSAPSKPRRMPICPMPSERRNTWPSMRTSASRTRRLSSSSFSSTTEPEPRNC